LFVSGIPALDSLLGGGLPSGTSALITGPAGAGKSCVAGAYLRAATENPILVRAFGIDVPRMVTLTYGGGVALAALAGVMAAPIYQVSPLMGSNIIIVVFAVVVIGGMGSIFGAILSGFGLGLIEGLTKVFYPEASSTVIFVIMALVLLVKPAGLFGRTA
jgi:branched-chain amino acid transport system permease protein